MAEATTPPELEVKSQDTGSKKGKDKSIKAFKELRVGQTVRIHQRIQEGEKERVQMFEGIIIAIRGKNDSERTMTVRKITSGVGVEKIFPLILPSIEKIEIVKQAKVRRAKLYYLRHTSKRLKEVLIQ
jgi:large subunit ribosomal protein L19